MNLNLKKCGAVRIRLYTATSGLTHAKLTTIALVLFEISYRRASQNYQKDRLFTAPSNIVLALIREAKKVL